MGYDIELVQMDAPPGTVFPVSGADANALVEKRKRFSDLGAIRASLLALQGCRSGPGQCVDFHGAGLNYARLFVRDDCIFVENSCGARELIKIYRHLAEILPNLLILDMQSRNLHNAESFEQWWSRPL